MKGTEINRLPLTRIQHNMIKFRSEIQKQPSTFKLLRFDNDKDNDREYTIQYTL